MKTNAQAILDSVIDGKRVTTLSVYFPRIVAEEVLRHRIYSYSSASSRAIPVKRMIDEYVDFVPDNWRSHQTGMQPKGIIEDLDIINKANIIHNTYMEFAKATATELVELGIAKEQANRYVMPVQYIKLIVTGTEWKNFFNLRLHSTAQHEIQTLAIEIQDALNRSQPLHREIHLPYVQSQQDFMIEAAKNPKKWKKLLFELIKRSVAKCARTSYYGFNRKDPTIEEDCDLYNKLVIENPPHMSPAEHQAFSYRVARKLFDMPFLYKLIERVRLDRINGNLSFGIVQFRKVLERGIKIDT
jgi:thymidylate synthase ThyX